ncbi:MAG: hypothetical protein WCH46_04120 [bacterium]
MEQQTTFKYNYGFLFQSIVVYATTLAAYILVRGLMIEAEFAHIFRDPLVYLLSAIILVSSLAVIYNVVMKRRITIDGNHLHLRGALREMTITRDQVRSVRIGVDRQRGLISNTRVVKIFLNERRRPALIRTYNFENSQELYSSLKKWAGDLLTERPGRRRRKA